MDDNSNFPVAQGQEQADLANNSQANEGAPQGDEGFKAGIEKRIGELTARYHKSEEHAQKLMEQNLHLTQQMAELLSKSQDRGHVEEVLPQAPEGLDPAMEKYLSAQFQRMEARFSGHLTQLGATVHRGEAASAAAQLAEKMGVKDASWIQERAAQLAAQWKSNNLPFVPKDAARFAMSEYMEKLADQPRNTNGQFVPRGHATLTAGNPSPNFQPATQRQPLPSNFSDLPAEHQIALLEKRGIDDIPL